jgi:hypothetical protein
VKAKDLKKKNATNPKDKSQAKESIGMLLQLFIYVVVSCIPLLQ